MVTQQQLFEQTTTGALGQTASNFGMQYKRNGLGEKTGCIAGRSSGAQTLRNTIKELKQKLTHAHTVSPHQVRAWRIRLKRCQYILNKKLCKQ